MVLAFVLFSEFTKAWLLYLGLIFLFMVMYAPGGFASLIMMNLRVAAFGKLRQLTGSYLALALTGLVALVGASAMVEMTYHLQLSSSEGPDIKFLWVTLNTTEMQSWLGAAAILAVGGGLFEVARRRFAREWEEIQAFIEKKLNPEEAQ